MREGASQTALLVAGYRARATQNLPSICNDPWAARLGGEEGLALSRRYDQSNQEGLDMHLWIALRTRALDDLLNTALDRGIEQVVILGAGLDMRAARLARAGVRFFEVDHPHTQADKLRRLAGLTDHPIDAASYVSCDFETQDFVEQLFAAGFDGARPALLVWEGVIYYLQEEAARSTLHTIASRLHPRSVVAFDFVRAKFVTGQIKRDEDQAALDFVDGLGEPLRFGIDDPVPLLHACGFRTVRTTSFDELALQHTGTYERSRHFRFQWIATASVGGAALC